MQRGVLAHVSITGGSYKQVGCRRGDIHQGSYITGEGGNFISYWLPTTAAKLGRALPCGVGGYDGLRASNTAVLAKFRPTALPPSRASSVHSALYTLASAPGRRSR